MFQNRNSYSTHCINHHLALAGKEFSTSFVCFEDIFEILDHIAHFYDYNTIQTVGLKDLFAVSEAEVFL